MKFIVDECTGDSAAKWLKISGCEVYSVYTESKGAEDEWILEKTIKENWIVVTNDKDFGELVFKRGKGHRGVISLKVESRNIYQKRNTYNKGDLL